MEANFTDARRVISSINGEEQDHTVKNLKQRNEHGEHLFPSIGYGGEDRETSQQSSGQDTNASKLHSPTVTMSDKVIPASTLHSPTVNMRNSSNREGISETIPLYNLNRSFSLDNGSDKLLLDLNNQLNIDGNESFDHRDTFMGDIQTSFSRHHHDVASNLKNDSNPSMHNACAESLL